MCLWFHFKAAFFTDLWNDAKNSLPLWNDDKHRVGAQVHAPQQPHHLHHEIGPTAKVEKNDWVFVRCRWSLAGAVDSFLHGLKILNALDVVQLDSVSRGVLEDLLHIRLFQNFSAKGTILSANQNYNNYIPPGSLFVRFGKNSISSKAQKLDFKNQKLDF